MNEEQAVEDSISPVGMVNYDQLGTIRWSELGKRAREMLALRINKSNLPSVVLLTQEAFAREPTEPRWLRLLMDESNTSLSRPSYELVVNSSLTVCYNADLSVQFKFKLQPFESTEGSADCDTEYFWQCPYCRARYSYLNTTEGDISVMLVAHLRCHLELRMCLNCLTVLPANATGDGNSLEGSRHDCSGLATAKAGRRAISLRSSGENGEEPLSVSTQPAVRKRRQLYHQKGSTLTCEECSLVFDEPKKFQQHKKNVHSGFVFNCNICNRSFSTKGNLNKHFEKVHNMAHAMQCPHCEAQLSTKFGLERHIKSKHTQEKGKVSDFYRSEGDTGFYLCLVQPDGERLTSALPSSSHEGQTDPS